MNKGKALYVLAPNKPSRDRVYGLVDQISHQTGLKTFYVYQYAIEMYWRHIMGDTAQPTECTGDDEWSMVGDGF